MPPRNRFETTEIPATAESGTNSLGLEVAGETMKRLYKMVLDRLVKAMPPEAREQAQAFLGAMKDVSGVKRGDKPGEIEIDFSKPNNISVNEKYGHGLLTALHIGNQLKFTPAYDGQTGQLKLNNIQGMTADVKGYSINVTDATVCKKDGGVALKVTANWHGMVSKDQEFIIPLPKVLAKITAG